jgi:shikimate kinase
MFVCFVIFRLFRILSSIFKLNILMIELPSTIFLVGFMASGKSTVGPVLAAKFNCPFIDLDRLIEIESGSSIADLITRKGEEVFRRIETETLRKAALDARVVIAVGGGAIMAAENRRIMSQAGIAVWLDASFELCWQRIQQDNLVRPLAPDEKAARERYENRLPLYRYAALHIPIEKDQPPDEIAESIIDRLRRDRK